MAQDAAKQHRKTRKRGRALINGLAAFSFAAALAYGGYLALVHPDTPLPPAWNPTEPLKISDPVTPLTGWKLNRAAADAETCLAVLDGFASVAPMPPLEHSDQCYINDRVALRGVGQAQVARLETRCAIALRLAMWERHSLQPAAAEILGKRVTSIAHIGSYSCRTMRTGAGPSTQMSTHATADAIDIAGFTLSDGTQIRLRDDWGSGGAKARYLRRARDGACDWFNLTLSPDYNQLHADHFHLQSRGWGLCR